MSNFLNGFADELTKEAKHPLFEAVTKGGTLLGRRVKGMVSRSTKKGKVKKFRMRKKATELTPAGAALKKKWGTPEAARKGMMAESQAKLDSYKSSVNNKMNSQASKLRSLASGGSPQSSKMGDNIMAPSFGSGKGLDAFKGQRAPAFTADTAKGKIGNPKENPENFKKKAKELCGPKYGCGKGKHGTGCGLRKRASEALAKQAAGRKTIDAALALIRSGKVPAKRLDKTSDKMHAMRTGPLNGPWEIGPIAWEQAAAQRLEAKRNRIIKRWAGKVTPATRRELLGKAAG